VSEQAGWEHLGIVENHQVGGPKQFWQLQKNMVRDFTGCTPDKHQTGLIAGLNRMRGNELHRKRVLKIRKVHAEMKP
jgi:hypothetical protein